MIGNLKSGSNGPGKNIFFISCIMAGEVGFEPTTQGLTVPCSAN